MVVIEAQDQLSAWLVKELSPICDADPAALAKYVLALLRKPDKSDNELRDICLGQLDVFLQSNTRRFVEKLFTSLGDKSYVPAATAETPSSAGPSPVAEKEKKEEKTEEKERKEERTEKKDDRKWPEIYKDKERKAAGSKSASQEQVSSSSKDRKVTSGANSAPLGKRGEAAPSSSSTTVSQSGAPPSSGASFSSAAASSRRGGSPIRAPRRRISPPGGQDKPRRRSRSPVVGRRSPVAERGRRVVTRRSPGERHRKERKSASRSRSRSPVEKERRRERDDEPRKKKQRCRDFDEKGFCMRGEQCSFDHGTDPVVVDDIALAKIVGGKAAVSAPPSFHVPPPGYNPLPGNPPPPGVEGYNPEAPGLSMGDFSVPPPPLPTGMAAVPAGAGGWRAGPPPYGGPTAVYDPSGGVPVDPHSAGMMMGGGPVQRGMFGRGRGRGGRGFHPYRQQQQPMGAMAGGEEKIPANVAARTLIVKKIPAELNSIAKLHEHFGQFGTITNLQIHYEGQPDTALISFASRFEAGQAYKNPEPIFNNRFIRVFWYGTINGEAAAGTKTTTLSSGITVETPVESTEALARPPKKERIQLPAAGETSYKNPEMVEARMREKQRAAAIRANQEQILRLTDLKRRGVGLCQTLNDQLKAIVTKLMKETEADKKKALTKMLKQVEGKLEGQKGETAELDSKLAALQKENELLRGEGPPKKEDDSSGEEENTPSPERDSVSPPAIVEGQV